MKISVILVCEKIHKEKYRTELEIPGVTYKICTEPRGITMANFWVSYPDVVISVNDSSDDLISSMKGMFTNAKRKINIEDPKEIKSILKSCSS